MAGVGTGTALPLSPQEMGEAREVLRRRFPDLAESFELTSERTPEYNCVAWAAGDVQRWWWPLDLSYWPEGVAREETPGAFVDAFATLGYAPCSAGDLEPGFEKVAIFAKDGAPTHMARQLADGAWTSKLGKSWDVRHGLPEGVGGAIYGSLVQYLSRRIVSRTDVSG